MTRARNWATALAGFDDRLALTIADAGRGAKAGRHAAGLSPRQPGQHVDPRGRDDRRHHADDGRVQ